MNIRVKISKGLKDVPEAMYIRQTVFVDEQGFIDEFDDIDEIAFHVLIFDGDKAVATGRVFLDEEKHWHAGRIAVLAEYRKQHMGARVMEALEECAKHQGADEIVLSAQMQAVGFYEKVGYENLGELHYDQGCPHITMKKHL